MTSTIQYDDHPETVIEVYRPTTPARWAAVLIHGGYWRSRWTYDLMVPMSMWLQDNGVSAYNVEYRRPDAHGWATTTADVASALTACVEAIGPDIPIVVLGHSAGGQLALRACADVGGGLLAVSLAGVVDLESATSHELGNGAVAAALGHIWRADDPGDIASSPRHRLPLGVPQLVACGHDDDPNLVQISHDYAAAAFAAGDEVTEVFAPGDHFDIITPSSDLWAAVVTAVEMRVQV
ncbi:alpha/beta hydrolase [Williamsia sp. CHRR-6]|uniref:alpha/beta hydrolase n=1 Tax=Williamsia sp. CHRR-6 TaxID=2835871 RepID=UPI001BDB4F5C|nr:alpha/beta hydrolase [Williamsia sp. CHRR-6]MBT0566482.1 alpha/beta hydrolase [Williamsia sp. CHRR-6]